mgnify:CR=1 FL=1
MKSPDGSVFSETKEMSIKYPVTIDELKNINGVGEGKAKKFGDSFLKIIEQYPKFNSLEIDENFNFTQKAKDSIIDFFRKNPEKLNNYDLNSFIEKIK